MNKKDIQLLSEAYLNEKPDLPSGEIGALAQTGVEELEDPSPEVRERPLRSNIFSIVNKMNKGDIKRNLGFEELITLHYTGNGMVAVFEHEDGNAYKFEITIEKDPKIIERI